MRPSLPQNDPLRLLRRMELAMARRTYAWDYSYEEVGYAARVPLRDKADLKYWFGLGKFGLQNAVNKLLAWGEAERAAKIEEEFAEAIADIGRKGFEGIRHVLGDLKDPPSHEAHPVDRISDYDAAYQTLREPLPMGVWDRDDVYAWQSVAGCNPVQLQGVTEVPAALDLDAARFASVVPGDSLADALAERRLYVADYAVLDGIPAGKTDQYQKYFWAPLAVYVSPKDPEARAKGSCPCACSSGRPRAAIRCSPRPTARAGGWRGWPFGWPTVRCRA